MPDASFIDVIAADGTWSRDVLALWTDEDGVPLVDDGAFLAYGINDTVSPVVAGAGQSGRSLVTSGWPLVSFPVMLAGEMFSIGEGNPYVLTADATADANGYATLHFVPPLRVSPDDGAPLEVARPTGRFWEFPHPSHFGPAERGLASGAASGFDFDIPNGHLWNPHLCPDAFLPWLAWAMSVDEWDTEWPEDRRREAIASAVALHRRKGTPWAMRRALVLAGYGDADLQERDAQAVHDGSVSRDGSSVRVKADEWAEYRVFLTRPISIAQAGRVRSLLTAYAPARCRLKAIDYQEALHLHNATVPRDGTYSRGIS